MHSDLRLIAPAARYGAGLAVVMPYQLRLLVGGSWVVCQDARHAYY
jgi:hypothetical protein